MSKQAYRASTAYAGAHLAANMWLWIGIFTAVTAVMWVLTWMQPQSGLWGHLVALAGMVAGTLVMMQSQVGFVSPYAPQDDEDDVVVATTPVPRA